jgi:acyl dehydratase
LTTPDDGGREPLYLDDLSVGQRFTSATYTMDEQDMLAFARRFDPQPFHLDDEAARSTLFGGLAASGWHTAGVTMWLQVTSGPPIAGGLIGAGAQIDWPRPTRAGETLRVESEILEVRPSRSRPDRGIVTMRSITLNQDDEVAQTLTVSMVVPRRP